MSKRILVDMDGVLAHYSMNVYKQMTERGLPAIHPKNLNHFYDDISYKQTPGFEHLEEIVNEIMHSRGFFYSIPVMEHAQEGIDYLLTKGHQLTICSAPTEMNEWCVFDKDRWLKQHFPVLRMSAIYTKFKTRISADYLIDDKPNIKKGDQVFPAGHAYVEPDWKHILFKSSFNSDSYTNDDIMFDWCDFHWLED